jgi:CRP-like cAMP-binding protein
MVDTGDLTGVPLFASLSESELGELATLFDVKTVSDGVELVGEGSAGYCFFILSEGGAVVTHDDETVVAELGPGDFFGEGALLGDDGRRNATVTTTAPSKLLFMFGTEFRRFEQVQPAVVSSIEETMRRRLETA